MGPAMAVEPIIEITAMGLIKLITALVDEWQKADEKRKAEIEVQLASTHAQLEEAVKGAEDALDEESKETQGAIDAAKKDEPPPAPPTAA